MNAFLFYFACSITSVNMLISFIFCYKYYIVTVSDDKLIKWIVDTRDFKKSSKCLFGFYRNVATFD